MSEKAGRIGKSGGGRGAEDPASDGGWVWQILRAKWVYNEDWQYSELISRQESSNRAFLEFHEFVRMEERREKRRELEMRENILEENRRKKESEENEKRRREEEKKVEMEAKERRAVQEMREVMTRMRKNMEAPAETDTMAAAETDTMAAAETDTMAAAETGQKVTATEGRDEESSKDGARWNRGRVYWKHSEYWNDPRWNQRSAMVSPPWSETGDIRRMRPSQTIWHTMCTSEEEENQGQRGGMSGPPGIEMHRYEHETEKLNERVWKLEERTEEWSWRGHGGTSAVREGGYDGRRDGEWGGWTQWDGEWWIRVGRSNLNSRQRRRVSRDLRRLIAREQNEVSKILRELKSAMWKGNESMEACEKTMQGGRSSDEETEKTKGGDDDDDETGSRGVGGWVGGGGNSWEKMRGQKRGDQCGELGRDSGRY